MKESAAPITVELWSFGIRPAQDEQDCQEELSPIPSDLQESFEFIVSLRHLLSIKSLPPELKHLAAKDGTDGELKSFLFKDVHANAELDFWEYAIKRTLRIRRERNIDRKQKKFRFGFASQLGKHRSVAFVNIIAYRLWKTLEPNKYKIVIEHFDLDKKHEVFIPDNETSSCFDDFPIPYVLDHERLDLLSKESG